MARPVHLLADTLFNDIRHALRRSRIRVAVLLALLRLGEAYAADIARLASVEPKWLRGAIFGDGQNFRYDDSLVALGLATVREGPKGSLFKLTPRGEQIARVLKREMMRELLVEPKLRA